MSMRMRRTNAAFGAAMLGVAGVACGQACEPHEIGSFQASSPTWGVAMEGSVLFVGLTSGVEAFDVSDPLGPVSLDSVDDLDVDFIQQVIYHDGTVYLPHDNGLAIVDASDPTELQPLTGIDQQGSWKRDVAFVGDIAYLAGYDLSLWDVGDPSLPTQLGVSVETVQDFEVFECLAISGDLLFGGTSDGVSGLGGIYVIDIEDPASPNLIDYYPFDLDLADAYALAPLGDRLIVGVKTGIATFDVSDPSNIQRTSFLAAPGETTDLVVDGDLVYASYDDFQVLDVSGDPAVLGSLGGDDAPYYRQLALDGQLVFASAFKDGVRIIDVGPCQACPADFNGDGEANVLDFVSFQAAWQAQDPAADCDANGSFDVLDFVCFQGVFGAGCG